MANITVQSPINGWLTRIESSRRDLIAAAQSGNRIASAFAMADARVELIETLKDEDIRARLLRMTDPSIAMVELANNPSDEDRIRVCAIAILSGFCPGEEQFAIFGAGRNKDGTPKAGKLYTKEAGFRILFAHLGIVPEVRTTHPEYIKFGTAGKSIWRVGGSASCTYRGDEYKVECAGDVSLGIPGYESDNVAGIAAKARRRMLQALWSKVSPILTTDHADDEDYDDPDTQPVAIANVSRVIEAPHVETKVEPEIAVVTVSKDEMEATINRHKQAGVGIIESLANDEVNAKTYGDLWDAVGNAKTVTQLKTAGKEIKEAGDEFTDPQLDPLRQWYTFRMNLLSGKIRLV